MIFTRTALMNILFAYLQSFSILTAVKDKVNSSNETVDNSQCI